MGHFNFGIGNQAITSNKLRVKYNLDPFHPKLEFLILNLIKVH